MHSTEDNALNNESEPLIDLSFIIKMGKGRQVFLDEMVRLYLVETPKELSQLHTALQAGDYGQIEMLSHKLKSSTGIIGLKKRGQDILEEMEIAALEKRGLEWMPSHLEEFEKLFNLSTEWLSAKGFKA